MQKEQKECAVCKTATEQRCSGCQGVHYCSREHQKLDWKIHSKNCQPCKLVVDSKIGRHYVATRDIKVGEIVLRDDKPLVTGVFNGIPVCLSCYDDLTADTATPCDKCGWPLCQRCTKHGAECEFTMKYRKSKVKIVNYDARQMIYKTIAVVRALCLRETDPEAYRKLLKMEDHCLAFATKPTCLDLPIEIARCVKAFFNFKDVELTEIARIAGIIQINGYLIKLEKSVYVVVYDKASNLEHNCRPNCSKSSTMHKGNVIWAVVPISKGEHITISYVDCRWSTMRRRDILARAKFFDCDCERCKDPTEFGTMFSVFRCFKDECAGFVIPPTFLAPDNELPKFVCNKCGDVTSWSTIMKMESQLYKQLNIMENDADANHRFVESHPKILHENHFSNFTAELGLIIAPENKYNAGGLSAFSDKRLIELIKRIEKLNNLFETLQPAEHQTRGLLLHILVHAKAILHKRQKPNSPMTTAYITERKQSLEKLYQLLRHEPPSIPVEYGIARAALVEIKKMQATEKSV